MNGLHEQLMSAARALSFPAAYRFAWFGKEPARLPPRLRRNLGPGTIAAHLANMLTEQLYRHFYCAGYARPVRWLAEGSGPDNDGFMQAFVEASGNRDRWQPGWTVRGCDGELIRIEREGLIVSTREEAIRCSPGDSLAAGSPVMRQTPAALLRWSQGFLVAIGQHPASDTLGEAVRFYWNVTPAGGLAFVKSAIAAFDATELPFQLKILADPQGYNRCDAAVLYLRRDDLSAARRPIEVLHRALRGELKAEVPVFTKQLGRGLGYAESPAAGLSFGQHRCGVMAQGLMDAQRGGVTDHGDRVDAILGAFEDAGIAPQRTYLSPDTDEALLEMPNLASAPRLIALERPSVSERSISPEDAARTIADYLCAAAIWHDGRCNWLVPVPGSAGYAGLRPQLYDGLAGVALFLAAASRQFGDPNYGRAALGALRSIVASDGEAAEPADAGFFSGSGGVALASLHIARATGDRAVAAASDLLVARLLDADLSKTGNDLLSGWAGTICVSLEIFRMTGDQRLLDLACAAGETLYTQRAQSRSGISWRTINKADEYNLTGFSHGTAGIVHALLQLHIETRDARWLDAAREGIRHEQHWFDPVQGNWPDLRESSAVRAGAPTNRDHSVYWCHGAPGIALARISAVRATGDPDYHDQARAALRTTLRCSGDFAIDDPRGLCLCHGLAGNADILLSAARILDDRSLVDEQLSQRLLNGLATTCRALGNERIVAGEIPGVFRDVGLMTGLAGLGWHCLRLIDCSLPSVLNCLAVDTPLDAVAVRSERKLDLRN